MANSARRMPGAVSKSYPDKTFEQLARRAGASVQVLWEEHGPPNTGIDWHVCYGVNGRPVIVQTYKNGDGWNVFTASTTIDVAGTVADALNRCGVSVPIPG